ncbi:MAG TPA: MauE/DoxX family redox-associated membrane protein [Acidimicrobiia bacterium]|nr:MauE/DoxX family redox-associated membrane protein [Acidimicrobiia bacterium]
MSALVGPFAIAACLLAIAGVAKSAQPAATAGALAALRLPHQQWMVRTGGLAEALLACAALVTGNAVLAILVALSYTGFALFVAAALSKGTPLSSCGCFGRIDTPPHPVHIVLDLLAAGAAIGVAAHGGTSIRAVLAAQPMGGVPFTLLLVIGVAAAALTMTALPRTLAVARGRA